VAHDPAAYGEAFADVYDDWYSDVSDVDATVAALRSLAGAGPVLELGVGTGRLALPLARTGIEVHGVDASPAMLARLAERPGGEAIRAWVGDMAELRLDGAPPFALVFAAFNTLCNLPAAAAQARCFARVASLLAPGGRFVVEMFVPGDVVDEHAIEVARVDDDAQGLVLRVSTTDASSQVVRGRHVEVSRGHTRIRPWTLRYATPEQLDEMAASAGLFLEWRDAGWRAEPFADNSVLHVSVWRRR
jgi:SAM-dependent methyltransferase